VSGLIDRLGIGAEVRRKAVLVQGGAAADRVASGEADIALQQISEILPVKGAVLAGPLPSEIQNYTIYSAAIAAGSGEKPSAQALIDLVRSSAVPWQSRARAWSRSIKTASKMNNRNRQSRRTLMDTLDRRTILATGALALAGARHKGSGRGASRPKAIFPVGTTTIPIVGETDVFPVRRIYCIGRNYAAHSREMGSDPTREPPFFFQKPTDAIQNVAIAPLRIILIPCSPRTITMRSSWCGAEVGRHQHPGGSGARTCPVHTDGSRYDIRLRSPARDLYDAESRAADHAVLSEPCGDNGHVRAPLPPGCWCRPTQRRHQLDLIVIVLGEQG